MNEVRVRRLLVSLLGRDLAEASHPVRAEEAAWDSLKHVELILNLESEFGIRFREEEMQRLDSLDAIVGVVNDHGAA